MALSRAIYAEASQDIKDYKQINVGECKAKYVLRDYKITDVAANKEFERQDKNAMSVFEYLQGLFDTAKLSLVHGDAYNLQTRFYIRQYDNGEEIGVWTVLDLAYPNSSRIEEEALNGKVEAGKSKSKKQRVLSERRNPGYTAEKAYQ